MGIEKERELPGEGNKIRNNTRLPHTR